MSPYHKRHAHAARDCHCQLVRWCHVQSLTSSLCSTRSKLAIDAFLYFTRCFCLAAANAGGAKKGGAVDCPRFDDVRHYDEAPRTRPDRITISSSRARRVLWERGECRVHPILLRTMRPKPS